MLPPSRSLETDSRRVVEEKLRDWAARGLLDEATRDRLLGDLDRRASGPGPAAEGPRFSIGIWLLLSLGTLSLAAAVAVWFAREWGDWGASRVPRAVLVPAILAGAGLLFMLARPGSRARFPELGRVFLALASIATMSATALLGATYDFHPRHATTTLLEAALFLVLAFLAESALLAWTGIGALCMAWGYEVVSVWGDPQLCFARPMAFVGLGFALVAFGLWARRLEARLAGHVLVAGSIVTLLSLYVLSLKGLGDVLKVGWTATAWGVLFLPFVIALALLAIQIASRGPASFSRAVFLPLFSLVLLFALTSLWPDRLVHRSWVDAVLFTLATLAGAVLGVAISSAGMVNVSVVFFALDVVSRFSEWLWDDVPAFLFFGLMGLLLIAGGITLEKVRRRLLRAMEERA